MRTPPQSFVDILVLGGGIAGATVAAHLAGERKVALLEREPLLAYHATGRSSAMFIPTYGGAAVRPLAAASEDFLRAPPWGFGGSLLHPRPVMHIARADQIQRLAAFREEAGAAAALERLDRQQARALAPILRPEAVDAAVLEHNAADIDVARLHAGYLRMAREGGAIIAADLGDLRLERRAGLWRATAAGASFCAPVVVNATGAWADQTAIQAGLAPLRLSPYQRTVVIVDAPKTPDFCRCPVVKDIDERFYFRPYSGQLLITPADEEACPPCDALPDPLDVACAMFRFAAAADHSTRIIRRRWAGLRTFAPDRAPVIGWSEEAPGFFWLAGLGGFGIQTSPAVGRIAAAMLLERSSSAEVTACDGSRVSYSPSRSFPPAGSKAIAGGVHASCP